MLNRIVYGEYAHMVYTYHVPREYFSAPILKRYTRIPIYGMGSFLLKLPYIQGQSWDLLPEI